MRGQIHIREEPGGSSPKRSLSQVLPEKGNDQLELTELADKLMDEGRFGEARELYCSVLLARSAATDPGHLGSAEPPPVSEEVPVLPPLGSTSVADWEAGGWQTDLQNLKLTQKPIPAGPRIPNSKRPTKALFVPTSRKPAVPASNAKPQSSQEGNDSTVVVNGAWDSIADDGPVTSSAIVQNGTEPAEASNSSQKAAQQRLLKPSLPIRPARSQLAKLQRGRVNDFPKGLDPPGLRDDAQEATEVPYEGRHILEIMGVKESDGDAILDSYLKDIEDFEIRPVLRWADSSHALVVFAGFKDAALALEMAPTTGRLWLKPYSQASAQCKQIAASELRPPTVRPKTSAVVAKRFLFNVLQNRQLLDLSGEEEMRAQRKERHADKERKQKQLDAAWED